MKNIIFPLLFLFPTLGFSQLFDPQKDWFSDENFFNKEVVKQNSLKYFKSKFSTKKDNKIIEQTLNFTMSEFDKEGRLKMYIKGSGWAGKVDSIIYAFSYDSSALIKTQDEVFSNIHYYFFYEYDKSDKLIKEIKFDLSKLPTHIVSTKHFGYENLAGSREKKLFLNDAGKTYMEEVTETENGKLVFKRLQYVKNSNYKQESYQYKGAKLVLKNTKGNIGKTYDIVYKYSYLDNGSIDEILISEDGKELQRIAFVYDRPHIPKAMVVRHYISRKIDIYEFEYGFY